MLRVDVGDSVDTSIYGGGASCSGPAPFDDHEYPHSSSVGSLRGGTRGSGGGVATDPGGIGNERWLYCEPRRVDRDVDRCISGDASVGVRGSWRSFIDCERVSVRAGVTGAGGLCTEEEEVAKNKGSDGRRPYEPAGTSRGGVDCERIAGRDSETGVGGVGSPLRGRIRAESGGVVPRLVDVDTDEAYCAGIWGTGGTSSP